MNEYTIEPTVDGAFEVYEHGTYPKSSVLAGCPRRSFMDWFRTMEAAKEKFPDAEVLEGSSKMDGYNSGDLMPSEPPSWFDPADAGEVWGEDDY